MYFSMVSHNQEIEHSQQYQVIIDVRFCGPYALRVKIFQLRILLHSYVTKEKANYQKFYIDEIQNAVIIGYNFVLHYKEVS